jgi:uncharacterized protein (TIGR00730 family)
MQVCVFCGSSMGADPIYRQTAADVGRWLASHQVGITYGGGRVGLMGVMADEALAAGGSVIGIMPRHLIDREIAHRGLTALVEVEDMHRRKLEMSSRADAFLALPGGIGTLEELLEQWTWAQLGIHRKPCALLNVGGYFDPLLRMMENMVTNGFLSAEYQKILIVDSHIERIMDAYGAYVPPSQKWVGCVTPRA